MEQIVTEQSQDQESSSKLTMLDCTYCAHLWLGRGNYGSKVICSNCYRPAHCSDRRGSDPDASIGDQTKVEIVWDNDIIWGKSDEVDKEVMRGRGFFAVDVFNRYSIGITLVFILVSDDGDSSRIFYFSNKSLKDAGLTNDDLIGAISELEDTGALKIPSDDILRSGMYPVNDKIITRLKEVFTNPDALIEVKESKNGNNH